MVDSYGQWRVLDWAVKLILDENRGDYKAGEQVLELPSTVRLRDERHETYSLEVVGAHGRAQRCTSRVPTTCTQAPTGIAIVQRCYKASGMQNPCSLQATICWSK